MKIGILSDSHGRGAITAAGARMLVAAGAELLIHCGDVCGESVIDALIVNVDDAGKPAPPVRVVFGNCDYDAAGLGRYAEEMGVTVDDPAGRLTTGEGKRIVFTHGHLGEPMRAALAEGVDYLLHGHTHRLRDERVGDTRVINPGALYRASRHTVALLDTVTGGLAVMDAAEFRG